MKHNEQYKRTRACWNAMKYRFNKNCKGHEVLHADSIKICKRWLNSFEDFIEDMGMKPKGLYLMRIDHKKNFNRKNCRWGTRKEINLNPTRSRHHKQTNNTTGVCGLSVVTAPDKGFHFHRWTDGVKHYKFYLTISAFIADYPHYRKDLNKALL